MDFCKTNGTDEEIYRVMSIAKKVSWDIPDFLWVWRGGKELREAEGRMWMCNHNWEVVEFQ